MTEQPDVISFAGGLPAPEVFPLEKFREACDTVLKNEGAKSLQYSTTEGCIQLRKWIADDMALEGLNVDPDNILITTGSQQALDLIGKILINPGDKICVESPTYLGAIQAWNAYEAEYITVPIDENGMVTSELETAIRVAPKFIYVIPNFQNPAGVSLSSERRHELIGIAHEYGVPIIEDDPYGQLRYEGQKLEPLIAISDKYNNQQSRDYSGDVIYLSTFSKILAPGIRVAWVIAPTYVIRKLVQAKQGTDLHTATINQLMAYELARNNCINSQIKLIKDVYRERRDVMVDAIEKYFPDNVKFTKPSGGLFLWGQFPQGFSTVKLLESAIKEKVAFVPGGPFHPLGGGENTMRLNFSNASPNMIEEGIKRLGKVINQFSDN